MRVSACPRPDGRRSSFGARVRKYARSAGRSQGTSPAGPEVSRRGGASDDGNAEAFLYPAGMRSPGASRYQAEKPFGASDDGNAEAFLYPAAFWAWETGVVRLPQRSIGPEIILQRPLANLHGLVYIYVLSLVNVARHVPPPEVSA